MTNKAIITKVYLFASLILGACGDPAAFEAALLEDDPVDSRVNETGASNGRGSNPHGPYGFDVAENMARFSFDEAPVDDDGLPAYGNSFVTQGYIYPFGFLINHEGTNEDGTPAYAEMVIGVWTCRGYFIGDGAKTTTGPWVISTQMYDFFETPGYEPGKASGRHNVVSEGYEIADVDRLVLRPITGATGQAREAGRQLGQILLGFNDSGGVDLRVVIPIGFKPIITHEDLPENTRAEVDASRCTYDLVEGLICPNAPR